MGANGRVDLVLQSFRGEFDEKTLSWASFVHGSIFESMPLEWRRRGTWVEAWQQTRRIAFAPHPSGASLYFQRPEPVQRYRSLEGLCKTGKVSIKIRPGSAFEAGLLALVIGEELRIASIEAQGAGSDGQAIG